MLMIQFSSSKMSLRYYQQLNLDKTKIMLIGNLRDKATSVYNIECVNNIKSLGIYVVHDKDVCIQHN